MDEVWAQLREATGNDHALITFLQQLMTVEPGPRANFGQLVRTSSYLQSSVPFSPRPAPSLPASLRLLPAEPTTALPLQTVPGPFVDKHVVRHLKPVPGLPSVLWDPSAEAVCQLSSGLVYRYIMPLHLQHMSACIRQLSCHI